MAVFPDGWWRADRPLILGHRGASAVAPENTLAAFEAALSAGADGVELDVHLTADGVPVVIHNRRVDDTTEGRGYVNDLTLAEIQRLDAGCRFRGVGTFADQHIPTLEEVLVGFADRMVINIELKQQLRKDKDLVGTVASLVARLGVSERVWFSSFVPYYLHRMRRMAPAIPCGLLFTPLNVGTMWLAPFTPFEAVHPQVTAVLCPWFTRLYHRLGWRVVTWTVDDPDRIRRLTSSPTDIVDAIITNDPGRVLSVLEA